MSLEIRVGEGTGPAPEMVTVTQWWYLTEDGLRVVPENHPDSRWLWAVPGNEVRRSDAIRLGALKEPAEEPPTEPEAEAQPARKRRGRPPNKKLTPGEDK